MKKVYAVLFALFGAALVLTAPLKATDRYSPQSPTVTADASELQSLK